MVVDYDLEGLSTELGISWKPLARRLEFGEAEIEGFDHDNKELRDVVYVEKKRGLVSNLLGLVQRLVSRICWMQGFSSKVLH